MTPVELGPIVQILSKISYIPTDEISAETNIFQDLDIDSLGIVETFVAIEKHFGLRLNPVIYAREDIQTPQKIYDVVKKEALKQSSPSQ